MVHYVTVKAVTILLTRTTQTTGKTATVLMMPPTRVGKATDTHEMRAN
jgi:hypothetical protein